MKPTKQEIEAAVEEARRWSCSKWPKWGMDLYMSSLSPSVAGYAIGILRERMRAKRKARKP